MNRTVIIMVGGNINLTVSIQNAMAVVASLYLSYHSSYRCQYHFIDYIMMKYSLTSQRERGSKS